MIDLNNNKLNWTNYLIIPLIIAAMLSPLAGRAQILPKTVKLTLTDKQVMRIDSAINYMANSTDSKAATKWLMGAFEPFYVQIRAQLDTVKVKPKTK